MKLKKLHSDREVSINLAKYKVDWDAPCRSKYQLQIKKWLRPYWGHHVCLEEFLIPGSKMRYDFVNLTKKIIVEMNGIQHDNYNKHFHRGNRLNFLSQVTRDQCKRDWAEANGFQMIEILPDDLPLSVAFFREKFSIELV